MVEAVWTLGMTDVFGIKHLLSIFSKKKLTFNLDFIVTNFKVKGLYLRHRHPFLLYLILFILLDRTLSLQNIFAVIFLSAYYILFSKMVETQLTEIYPKDFEKYRSSTNYFRIMLKKYQDEPTKK
jgi:protein-S-isoprenylcysteine O-methyltransferase Ste14